MQNDSNDIPRQFRRLTIYEVNGVRYERIDDVPEEFRKFLEDKNDNGVPDIIEDASLQSSANAIKKTMVRTETRVIGNELSTDDFTLGRLLRDRSKPANIRCTKCQYDLSATPIDSRCPECGQEVLSSIMALTHRSPAMATWRTVGSGSFRWLTTLATFLLGAFAVMFVGRCLMR